MPSILLCIFSRISPPISAILHQQYSAASNHALPQTISTSEKVKTPMAITGGSSTAANASESSLSNQLLRSHVRAGRMRAARALFDEAPEKTLVSYTILMSGYALHGPSIETLFLLFDMLCTRISPDPFVLSVVLRACASIGFLHCGRQLHSLSLKMETLDDLFVTNALMDMYSGCGLVLDTEHVFKEIKQPDLVSWSCMLSGYTKNGEDEKTLRLLAEMVLSGTQPDAFVLSIGLKASLNLGITWCGIQIHCCTIKTGYDSDTFLINSLMEFYGRTDDLVAMRQVFGWLCQKDLVSWNIVISCYAEACWSYEALELFRALLHEKGKCSEYTLGSVLQAVADLGALRLGKEIHGYVIKAGFGSNGYVISALIDTYIEVISGNPIAYRGNGMLPLKLFKEYYSAETELDEFIVASILKYCASQQDLETGKMIHSCIFKLGMEPDIFVISSLVDVYAKCGIPDASLRVFEGIQDPGVVPWSAVIAGYCWNGLFQKALQLFNIMQCDLVKPNEFTLTSVIQACTAMKKLRTGKEIHNYLIKAGYLSNASVANTLNNFYLEVRQPYQSLKLYASLCEDETPWNPLILAFARVADHGSILRLLNKIQCSHVQLKESTANYILDYCRNPSLLHTGMQAHAYIAKIGLVPDHKTSTALMNMYSRCGSIELAANAFKQILEKTSASWASIILANVDHNCPSKALKLFAQMRRRNKSPDSSTFLSVLKACCQMGLVDDAFHIFVLMYGTYRINPSTEHYHCMVEILSRAGMFKEAKHFNACSTLLQYQTPSQRQLIGSL